MNREEFEKLSQQIAEKRGLGELKDSEKEWLWQRYVKKRKEMDRLDELLDEVMSRKVL